MIFNVEFLLATQQIATITGLPMTHAHDRLTRATEVLFSRHSNDQARCSPSQLNGYNMAQMFHVLVRESVGLLSASP